MWRSALLLLCAGCSFQARSGELPGGPDAPSATPDGNPDGSPDGSAAAATKQRVKLTFQNGTRSEALVGFAVLVALDATRIDYAACPAGANLRFTDPDGTQLPYEIERWNPAGRSFVWVRVPQIDAASDSDFIYMHYGDATLGDAQMPAQVWSHAVAVYHLATDPTGAVTDSTGLRDGTSTPQMTAADVVDGRVGKGMRFDGTGGGIHATSVALSRFTWMMWLDADAAPHGGINHEPLTDGDSTFNFAWDHTSAAYIGALASYDTNNQWHAAQFDSFTGSAWYFIAGTYDGLSLCLHVGVGAAGETCVAAATPTPPGTPLQLGDATSGATTFAGVLDEVRIYDVAHSDAWLDAEHASQSDNLITYGAPEADP